jgi:mannose-6-phosphate isomerase-like protein (cupin superfamily)
MSKGTMMNHESSAADLRRPYLVIPKLIEQPTWGGQYIVQAKGWDSQPKLAALKIGQSYELFSGSNLSLLTSSEDPLFRGELTDRDAVAHQTAPDRSVALQQLVKQSADGTLGEAQSRDSFVLIKFTQALGNSFQTHVISDKPDPYWQPKPESWYYFEPGLITLGVKPGIDWNAYEQAVIAVHDEMTKISEQIKSGSMSFDDAKQRIKALNSQFDPWQFVNTVATQKDQLVDLSCGGLHHSWEEDSEQAPLGNVLYELCGEAMDKVATMRSFDKGKMEPDGSIRQLQIKDYFALIDRSAETNDPTAHIRKPESLEQAADYNLDSLLKTPYYNLDKLSLAKSGAHFEGRLTRFKHLFVKSGKIEVTAGTTTITVTAGHSCFIPAAAESYIVKNLADLSEILVSY